MTSIDEAITMMHEWADYDCYNEEQIQASEAFNQIAEWLEDYKRIKMLIPIEQALKAEYNKAIDDFVNLAKEHTFKHGKEDITICSIGFIEFFAEQLKAGGENDNLRR